MSEKASDFSGELRFYVDPDLCFHHGKCRKLAPANIDVDSEQISFFSRQPETAREERQCRLAMESCPSAAIKAETKPVAPDETSSNPEDKRLREEFIKDSNRVLSTLCGLLIVGMVGAFAAWDATTNGHSSGFLSFSNLAPIMAVIGGVFGAIVGGIIGLSVGLLGTK